jgi:hypothetical protein
MFRRRISRVGVLLVVSGLIPGFFAGVVSARTWFATSVNVGLGNALSSVGQNLFGEAAFGVTAIPGNPVTPTPGSVQMDVSSATQVPVSLNVFSPGGNIPGNPVAPCQRVAQIATDANGNVAVKIASPSSIQVQYLESLGQTSSVPAACAAPVN